MPTRPSSSEINIAQDARKVLADLKKALPAILRADKAKKKTGGVNAAFAKTFADTLAQHVAATKASSSSRTQAKSATGAEVKAREALSAELKSIRDDVAETLPDDIETQTAFGRGRNLEPKTTGTLIAAASDFEAAFETHALAVKPAGVNAARIARLGKMREALSGADASQRGKLTSKQDDTGAKSKLLGTLKKMAAQARKRLAKVVSASAKKGKRPSVAKSTSPRKRIKPRAKKTTPSETKS